MGRTSLLFRAAFAAALAGLVAGCGGGSPHAVSIAAGADFGPGNPVAVSPNARDDLGIRERLERELRANGFAIAAEGAPGVFRMVYDFEESLTWGDSPQWTLERFSFRILEPGSRKVAVSGEFSQKAAGFGSRSLAEVVAGAVKELARAAAPPPAAGAE